MKKLLLILTPAYLFLTLTALISELLLSPLPYLPDSRLLLSVLIIGLIVAGLSGITVLSKRLLKISNWLLPWLSLATLILLVLESNHGVNYVRSVLNLSYSRLFYLLLACFNLSIYYLILTRNKQLFKRFVFFFPVFLFISAQFVYVRDQSLFRFLIKEDSLVENTQAFLFFSSSLLSFFLAKYWWPRNKYLSLLFGAAALCLLLITGEEISWGQRILNIDTPSAIEQRNLQNEITIHNIDSFFGLVYRGYMLLGLYGGSAWIFYRLVKPKLSTSFKQAITSIVPNWYFSLYFWTAFGYNLDRFYLRHNNLKEKVWEEPMELLLIMGGFLFLLHQYAAKYPKSKPATILRKFLYDF